MPRSYSSKFLLTLSKPDAIMDGQLLAKLCVEANLPASYVCKVFGISRMALHTWFRGGPIRHKRPREPDQNECLDLFPAMPERDPTRRQI